MCPTATSQAMLGQGNTLRWMSGSSRSVDVIEYGSRSLGGSAPSGTLLDRSLLLLSSSTAAAGGSL